MQSKLAKISLLLLAVAIIVRFVSVFVRVGEHYATLQDTLNGLLGGLIISLVVILIVFVFVSRVRKRYERAVRKLSKSSEAFICTLPYAASYCIISADGSGITLWRLKGSTPVAIQQWPWQDVSVEKASVSVTAVRTCDGFNISSKTHGPSFQLVIYSDASTALSSPISGQSLDEVIIRWQREQPKMNNGASLLHQQTALD